MIGKQLFVQLSWSNLHSPEGCTSSMCNTPPGWIKVSFQNVIQPILTFCSSNSDVSSINHLILLTNHFPHFGQWKVQFNFILILNYSFPNTRDFRHRTQNIDPLTTSSACLSKPSDWIEQLRHLQWFDAAADSIQQLNRENFFRKIENCHQLRTSHY